MQRCTDKHTKWTSGLLKVNAKRPQDFYCEKKMNSEDLMLTSIYVVVGLFQVIIFSLTPFVGLERLQIFSAE